MAQLMREERAKGCYRLLQISFADVRCLLQGAAFLLVGMMAGRRVVEDIRCRKTGKRRANGGFDLNRGLLRIHKGMKNGQPSVSSMSSTARIMSMTRRHYTKEEAER